MAKKKTFTETQLRTLSADEVNKKIIYENYSLLRTLGGEKLRREMVPVGKICKIATDHFLKTGPKNNDEKRIKNAKKKIVKTLKKYAPCEYAGFPKDSDKGLVIGFNHPSLGEIARTLLMKVDVMGDKPMLFPVNLPWYEALASYFDKLKSLGIVITPTITPSTWAKLAIPEDSPIYSSANKLKRGFRDMYTDLSIETIRNGGVIFVAPSATRQRTVFKTKAVYEKTEDIIPTMSILALKLFQDKSMDCDFLPMAVLPPVDYKRGLNLKKKYKLIPGEIMTAKYIRKTYFKEENPKRLPGFDYDFHLRIAEKLPKDFWY